MTDSNLAVVVLAAGLGTRMKSDKPKVLHEIAGRPMIAHLLATVSTLEPARGVVVVAPGMEHVARKVEPWPVAVQQEQRGTAHAVLAARDFLEGGEGDVLVLFADTPLVSQAALRALLARLRTEPKPVLVALGFRPAEPGAYGRLLVNAEGTLDAIVEAADASEEQRGIALCNSGVMAIDARHLLPLLDCVQDRNVKGEYYLTDIIALARRDGRDCAYVEAPADELIGVNSRADLALAEAAAQRRLRAIALANGATMTAPETVWLCHDTRVGRDVTIGPNVVFGPGVVVEDRAEIRAFCHIEGAHVEAGAVVGPFARLRPGARIGRGAHIGNFVEIKNAVIEEGAKANHLAYLGDARVGAGANVGAGTVTCNYDGYAKYRTDIGAGAFIGTNSSLIAPVKIGDGAYVGTGSVINRDVPPGALAVARAKQEDRPGWVEKFRARKRAEAAAKSAPMPSGSAASEPAGKPAPRHAAKARKD